MENREQFQQFKLNKQLLNAISDAGYENPTPIQSKAIPKILNGHDLLGIAPTGTGKTAAYVIPILMKLKYAQTDVPRALILAPTRELVLQIAEVFTTLSCYTDLRTLALYGGVGIEKQMEHLSAGADIIIATPGRWVDVYRKGGMITREIKTLVLDEGDKMMDMGFLPQIWNILEKIPVKRQNLLFSATFPPKVDRLAGEFLEFPEKVEVAPQSTVTEQVKHFYYSTPNFRTKLNLLLYLLESGDIKKIIVFVKTKQMANNIFKFLSRKSGHPVRVIHSNKAQQTRFNAIKEFKHGDVKILVTTDITARGHDIDMVSHVVNFDVPVVYEDYVHRVGRTGRATHSGEAITFANPAEEMHLKQIEKRIQNKIPQHYMPAQVEVTDTEAWEKKLIEREIDHLKKLEDPGYKGAFHSKKKMKSKISGNARKKRK